MGLNFKINIFQDDLAGLFLIGVEFNIEEKNWFSNTIFCFIEVTKEDFLVGGMLCGKRYQDIEENLIRLGYNKIPSHILFS